jgi:hypothetical protein
METIKLTDTVTKLNLEMILEFDLLIC